MSSVSPSSTPGFVNVAFTVDSTAVFNGVTCAFENVTVTINSTSTLFAQLSGTDSASAAYGSTASWSVSANYVAPGGAVHGVFLGSGSIYVPYPPPPAAQPPAPPAPATVTATDNTTNVVVQWSAVSAGFGYSIEYTVTRGGTVLSTTGTGTSYTDTTPGSGRPITYAVTARSIGNGSTYSGDVAGGSTSVTTNRPPNQAVATSPPNGQPLDRTVAQTFAGTFSDPDPGDRPSQLNLRARRTDVAPTPAWTTFKQSGTGQTIVLPAATFDAGAWEWQIAYRDAAGAPISDSDLLWSTSSHFTAVDPPAGPIISSPTAGGTVSSVDPLQWTATDQIAWRARRVADATDGSADTSVIYWDSGEQDSADVRETLVSFDVNERYEHLQLQIEDSDGLWSEWVDVRVHVTYTPPALPVMSVITNSPKPKQVQILIEMDAPTGDQPTVTSLRVEASADGGQTPEWSVVIDPIGAVVFPTPASNRDYAFRVTATGSNGETSSTGWQAMATADGGAPDVVFDNIIDGGRP